MLDKGRQDVAGIDQHVGAAAGRHAARLAEDERDPHGPVERGERPRVVAHAPEAALAAGQTLVAGEDNESIAVEPQPALLQPEEDHGRDDQHVQQRRNHPAEHRRRERLHHFRARPRAPHDRKEPHQDRQDQGGKTQERAPNC